MAHALNERDFADPISYRIATGTMPGLGEVWLDPHGEREKDWLFGSGG